MSGALTRAMHTLDELALATDTTTEADTAIASAASSTTPVVLAGIGLLVTIGLAVIGWIIVDRRRNKDRAADVDNDDLNELIRLLRDTDIEVRRIASQPHPADRGDFLEIERLTPHLESHGVQTAGSLETLVDDVVASMKAYVQLSIDANAPIGELATRIRQQTRATDNLLATITKALTSARQMRS